jgi:hypothetical protein
MEKAMREILLSINFKTIIWAIPILLMLHELEEWNILEWYDSTFQGSSPSNKLGIRLWIVLVGIVGFVITAVSSLFPELRITATIMVILALITVTNGLQHIYWTITFKKYSPGVVFATIGLAVGLLVCITALVQNIIPIYYIVLLGIPITYIIVHTIKAGKTLTKEIYRVHEFSNKLEKLFLQ